MSKKGNTGLLPCIVVNLENRTANVRSGFGSLHLDWGKIVETVKERINGPQEDGP